MDPSCRSLTNALIEVLHELGLDIRDVIWLIAENSGLREFYQDISSQIIAYLPEQKRCVGRQRSLIRRIGSFLPIRPSNRVYIQILPMCKRLPVVEKTKEESPNDMFPALLHLGDLGWLEGDSGESRVLARAQCNIEPGHTDAAQGLEITVSRLGPRTSTPIGTSSGFFSMSEASVAPETALRMLAMENELATLRAAIAGIVLNQEHGKLNTIAEEVSHNSGDYQGCGSLQGAPPPPPPPPPAVTTMNPLTQLREHLTKVKELTCSNPVLNKPARADMASVLKGLGSVKLRPVERSPGGTPIRTRPLTSVVDPSDPAALLAAALRKRFEHIACESTEKEEDWSSSYTSSPECASPNVKQTSHIERCVGRRISVAGS